MVGPRLDAPVIATARGGIGVPDEPTTDRFESTSTWNAMFSHRVRVRSTEDVDYELASWIRRAYDRAG